MAARSAILWRLVVWNVKHQYKLTPQQLIDVWRAATIPIKKPEEPLMGNAASLFRYVMLSLKKRPVLSGVPSNIYKILDDIT